MGNTLKFYVGIDPGLSGAIAFLREDGALQIFDMPTELRKVSKKNQRFIDVNRLAERFDRHDIAAATVEKQSTRPGQAAQSVLKTGMGYGLILGVLAANFHPFEIVTPVSWKKFMAVNKDKNKARARASELMPRAAHRWALAAHDGRAEAAMLALYCMESKGLEVPEVFAA